MAAPFANPEWDPDEPYQGILLHRLQDDGGGERRRIQSHGRSRLGDRAVSGGGDPNARSLLAFLYGMGMTRERNNAKAFLYHHFAPKAENIQSKMALAYSYLRQDTRALFAYNGMGYLHVKGYGVDKKNYTKGRVSCNFYLWRLLKVITLEFAWALFPQEIDPAAKLPVTLALSSLWIRKNYADGFLVFFSIFSFFSVVSNHYGDGLLGPGDRFTGLNSIRKWKRGWRMCSWKKEMQQY
ncbi:hypothetical protein Dsin_033106 [Dipteronia sinensis]|uniref:Uncharacterized protein n=1 Tax=Dipteronia sinensis TaxID=43782 RepID=A0AAE0DI98_9ROSI|nr:hypothetical protein Dsin_033106 [Dipteronia sinensis]